MERDNARGEEEYMVCVSVYVCDYVYVCINERSHNLMHNYYNAYIVSDRNIALRVNLLTVINNSPVKPPLLLFPFNWNVLHGCGVVSKVDPKSPCIS